MVGSPPSLCQSVWFCPNNLFCCLIASAWIRTSCAVWIYSPRSWSASCIDTGNDRKYRRVLLLLYIKSCKLSYLKDNHLGISVEQK